MDPIEWAIVRVMGLLVLGTLAYGIVRLMHEPRTELDERSTRLARLFLYPRFLDPLLAKHMTSREKIGWLVVIILMIAAIAFTLTTGIGVRR